MKFLRDLKAVSEFLFFLMGLLLLLALLFWRNGVWAWQAEVFLRSADLPFALIGLLFAGSTIRLAFIPEEMEKNADEMDPENANPVLDAVLIVLGLIIFCGLLYMDIGLPDRL